MKKVVVLSGGLDSTVLTHKLVAEYGAAAVIALSFQYGQRHSVELECAKTTCQGLGIEHRIIDISFLGDIVAGVSALSATSTVAMPEAVEGDVQPVTYVPFRNTVMNSIALSFAESNGADAVYSGMQLQDSYGYWDTTTAFIDAMNAVCSLNRRHAIELRAPFANLCKADEILIGLELGVDFRNTWTCYSGDQGEGACGTCPSCVERLDNFKKVGVKDPIKYVGEQQ